MVGPGAGEGRECQYFMGMPFLPASKRRFFANNSLKATLAEGTMFAQSTPPPGVPALEDPRSRPCWLNRWFKNAKRINRVAFCSARSEQKVLAGAEGGARATLGEGARLSSPTQSRWKLTSRVGET